MENGENGGSGKPYELEERTFVIARDVRRLLKQVPRTVANIEDGRQLIRASGSVGANYIEANDALSKKDFLLRAKISRREAKESRHFLRLLDTGERADVETSRQSLVAESTELVSILSAIIRRMGGA
jgi:four helix bundle protein